MKKISAILICMSMLLASVAGFSLVAYAEGTEIPYGDTTVTLSGSGTEADPYIIDSGEKFAAVFGTGNTEHTELYTKHYLQTEDIALPADYMPYYDGNAIGPYAFTGSYKGDVKYRIVNIGTRNITADNFALIGAMGAGSSVSNIHVIGSVSGANYISSIAILCSGKISNCKSSVSFSGTSRVGGIVTDLRGEVNACIFDGSIAVTGNYIGGIAAYNNNGASTTKGIYNCIVSGTIGGVDTTPVGGIISVVGLGIGTSSNYSFEIKNNMFIGDITAGSSRSGAILGYVYARAAAKKLAVTIGNNLVATPDFTIASIERFYGASVLPATGVTAPNVKLSGSTSYAYCPAGSTPYNNERGGVYITDVSELTGSDLPTNLNSQVWAYFPQGGNNDFKFPQIKANPWTGEIPAFMASLFEAAPTPSISASTVDNVPTATITTSSSDTALGFEITVSDENGTELGTVAADSTTASLASVIEEDGTYKLKVKALGGYSSFESAESEEVSFTHETVKIELEGSGTSSDPYIIATGEKFAEVFGSGNRLNTDLINSGKFFSQTADITLPSDYAALHISGLLFTGNYNGNGYKIDFGEREDAPLNTALFYNIGVGGYVNGINVYGTIGNNTKGNYGSIANANYGTITNCKSYVDFNGTGQIGGIVMDNEGLVQDCVFSGTITGDAGFVGGIAGANRNGSATTTGIRRCFVNGTIGSTNGGTVGGIIGCVGYLITEKSNYSFEIRNNMFAGDITAGGTRSGAILGYVNAPAAGTLSVTIGNNFVATPNFTIDSIERFYGAAVIYTNSLNSSTAPNVKLSGATNYAYCPSGSTPYNYTRGGEFVTDISELTGPDLPENLNSQLWAYFPEGGNPDYKFPQLKNTPYPEEEEIPAFMTSAFSAAGVPSVTIDKSYGAPAAVITTANDDSALGFEITVADANGAELGVISSEQSIVTLGDYITSEGTYKIKVKSLGGYNTFESAYGDYITYNYEIELPEEIKTAEKVFVASENNGITVDDVEYDNAAVVAAQAIAVQGYEREYGVLLSTGYETDINNYYRKLVGANISDNGQYGILIYGEGITPGKIYFARPYAKYTAQDSTETVVYGETQMFVLR